MGNLVKLVRAANPRSVLAAGAAASFALLVLLREILRMRYAEEIAYALSFVAGMMLGSFGSRTGAAAPTAELWKRRRGGRN
jgi:uncharacterized membrane protein